MRHRRYSTYDLKPFMLSHTPTVSGKKKYILSNKNEVLKGLNRALPAAAAAAATCRRPEPYWRRVVEEHCSGGGGS